MTYISNNPEDEVSSSIALDFSHKIKQYFNGNSDECNIPNMLMSSPWVTSDIKQHFEKLSLIFIKVSKMKKRI